jgi:hypothetical protein
MPFQFQMHPYTSESVLRINPNQNGVYGIFRDSTAVYIGSGDIRERMLAHLNGDNACIVRENPNQRTSEVLSGDPTAREGELIREYQPICNLVVPR